MDLFSLVAKLTLDSSGYEQGISNAESSAQSFASKLKSGLGTAAKVGAAAIAAVSTAATAMTKSIVDGTKEVAAYGDNIDKASQKLGISAQAYQEWDAVLQHSGASIDSLGVGMKTLASKAQSGSDAFKALGISQKDAAKMSREELFSRTVTALQNVKDENKRSALAMELFGKSAMELGPLLNTSAADTQAMKERVHELGGVMSDEAVKAAAAFQDSMQDMQTAIDGAKRSVMSEFLPSLTKVMDGVTDLFTGGGTKKLSKGISQFVDKIGDMIPKVMEKGSEIVLALSKAVVKNLPKMIDAATSAIMTLAKGLVAQLPMLVESGLQIVLSLARSIADALPELIPAIVDVMLKIVDVLTEPETLSQLVNAAIIIMAALATGILHALPKLIEKAPEIISNLISALINEVPRLLMIGPQFISAIVRGIQKKMDDIKEAAGKIGENIKEAIKQIVDGAVNWGKDLVTNFINGIKSMWDKAKGVVSDFAGMVKSFLGFSEPEQGPLKDFHTYAPDMVELFAQGIEDSKGVIAKAIGDTFTLPTATRGANTGAGQEIVVPRGDTGDGGRDMTIIFKLADDTELGRAVYRLYNNASQTAGLKIAGVM